MEDVIVIGGGLAGLAASVGLAERGVAVTLLEARPRLGGRASSFVDQTTGATVDNCQHVSMGCCTNFRHFCETVGVADLLRTEDTLYFAARDGIINPFSAGWLPAPLHLFPAFRRLSYLGKSDLAQLQRGLKALARIPTEPTKQPTVTQPFDRWLKEHGQQASVIESFWHVVLVSALSETLDRIDTFQARKVFYDGFLAHRRGWEVQIPKVPLGELYGPALQDWMNDHRVTVQLKTGVERLNIQTDRVASVSLRDGETLEAGRYVLAVPHHRVGSFFPEEFRNHPQIAGAGRLDSAPISSVHLWFDRPITELPHAVLIGRLSQWMFNRSVLQKDSPQGNSWYYQVVISASRELDGRTQEQIVQEVVEELAALWPEAANAKLQNARVVTEHRAVFSVMAGSEAFRSPQQSPFENLQFAGDWTQTGWPATMEGAVRSGYLAAENVLLQMGQPTKVLQPDLPVSWLTRLLLGGRGAA